MTSTKAQKANGGGVSTSIVVPQSIAETMNITVGDKISWTLENRGDAENPYLVAIICNESNQATTTRKLHTCIRELEHAFDELKESYDFESEYSSALKSAWENSKKLVEGLEKELELYKERERIKSQC
jgi:bifunctional DNA-binding transcriptional regulator/antitoxin component of YhaV-PrlF toxin-antitoxin module